MRSDFEGEIEGTPADGVIVPAEEQKKIAKWIQQSVTKLGASAAVADELDWDGLKPMAEDLIKAVTAAFGILLALRRSAGPSLREELKDVGSMLAEAVESLGKALGTPTMALNSGKVLDRVKRLEKISPHNRGAIRRRILHSLTQLRDANRELAEALHSEGAEEDDDDDDDEISNDSLDQDERHLIETVIVVLNKLEDAAKQGSQQCTNDGASLSDLEMVATYSMEVAHAIDGLVADATGGLDIPRFTGSLEKLRTQCGHLMAANKAETIGKDLECALKDVEAALLVASDAAAPGAST